MCFEFGGTWIPEIHEEWESVADFCSYLCLECHRSIDLHQTAHFIRQQEHECCQRCAFRDCNCPRDENGECPGPCRCPQPDYGDTYHYVRCLDCHKFIHAIECTEREAGCPPSQLIPPLTFLRSALFCNGQKDSRRYFTCAQVMYPELFASGYLNFLHHKIFFEDYTSATE